MVVSILNLHMWEASNILETFWIIIPVCSPANLENDFRKALHMHDNKLGSLLMNLAYHYYWTEKLRIFKIGIYQN